MKKQELGPLQKAWVEALRSGEFKQGTSCLQRDSDTFCCLGVACIVAERLGKTTLTRCSNGFLKGGALHHQLSVGRLFKFYSVHGNVRKPVNPPGRGIIEDLVNMNDDGGFSFTDIADLVEADPGNFFSAPA